MACSEYTIKGLAKGCKDSIGGIVKVWVADAEQFTENDLHLVDSSAAIGIDTSVKADKFKPFNFFKNTGSMTTTANISDTAGTSFSTEVSLQFMKMETKKRIEFMGLLMNETRVIVKDTNKKYWYLGYSEPVTGSAGTAVTGTAAGDLNGYTVTLKDDSIQAPYEIVDASNFLAEIESFVVL